MKLDHFAIQTQDPQKSVAFYTRHFGAKVLYADATWAFIDLDGQQIAFVRPDQHPNHVAFRVSQTELETKAREFNKPIQKHRDGTSGVYLAGHGGAVVELIHYPDGFSWANLKPVAPQA